MVLVTFLSNELLSRGFEDAQKMKAITMWIVFVSIIFSSLIAALTASYFKVKGRDRKGVMIAGGSQFSLQLGKKLSELGFNVLIVTKSWKMNKLARMEGLETYYGEILSEQAHFSMNFSDYEYLIISTLNPAYNSLIYTNFLHEFGRNNIFQIKVSNEGKDSDEYQENIKGQIICEENTLTDLNKLLVEGYVFKDINISENFTTKDLSEEYNNKQINLFSFDRENMELEKIDSAKKATLISLTLKI